MDKKERLAYSTAWNRTKEQTDKHLAEEPTTPGKIRHWEVAESLRPSPEIVERYAEGERTAIAIIDRWKPCLGWQDLIVEVPA